MFTREFCTSQILILKKKKPKTYCTKLYLFGIKYNFFVVFFSLKLHNPLLIKFNFNKFMDKEAVKLIRKIRIEKNYSQEYLASKLNISQSYYGRIENGKTSLNLKTLKEILIVFEIDYCVFFSKIKESEN